MNALLLLALVPTAPVPASEPQPPPKATWKITCDDGSTFNVQVLDTHIPLKTKYGDLKIPAHEIQKIEFANRLSHANQAEVDGHIKNLGSPDFKTREEATAALRDLKHRSYPACVKACKSTDPEVARRADDVVRYTQANCDPNLLVLRPDDVIYTADSKLTGQISVEALKVRTGPFGEQNVRLTDLRLASTKTAATNQDAVLAPVNMSTYTNQAGNEYTFKLTGGQPGAADQMGCWGTDVYTLDSNLGIAAVHAGVLRPGEEGVVRVRLVPSPQTFLGSDRNGVTSTRYGFFQNGAYEFVRDNR